MTPIFQCKFGSHLYGLETPNSDVDVKGVFIPSKEDIILQRCVGTIKGSTSDGSRKNTSEDVDHEMMSLQYFCGLLSEGKTVAIDMIHCPKERSMIMSPVWEYLRENRHRFYTKRMIRTCVSYMEDQVVRYGLTGTRIDNLAQMIELLKSHSEDKLETFIDQLEEFAVVDEDFVTVFGAKYPLRSRGKTVLPSAEQKFSKVGERYLKALRNEDINWKDVSHAFRAGQQMLEILITGDLIYPFDNESIDIMLGIKMGRDVTWNDDVRHLIELQIEMLRPYLDSTDLPDEVDQTWVDHFVYCQYHRATQPDFWS